MPDYPTDETAAEVGPATRLKLLKVAAASMSIETGLKMVPCCAAPIVPCKNVVLAAPWNKCSENFCHHHYICVAVHISEVVPVEADLVERVEDLLFDLQLVHLVIVIPLDVYRVFGLSIAFELAGVY